jgi:hypothetical protein
VPANKIGSSQNDFIGGTVFSSCRAPRCPNVPVRLRGLEAPYAY